MRPHLEPHWIFSEELKQPEPPPNPLNEISAAIERVTFSDIRALPPAQSVALQARLMVMAAHLLSQNALNGSTSCRRCSTARRS
jgi:hypothetical protein